jgi:hypothetical protein
MNNLFVASEIISKFYSSLNAFYIAWGLCAIGVQRKRRSTAVTLLSFFSRLDIYYSATE